MQQSRRFGLAVCVAVMGIVFWGLPYVAVGQEKIAVPRDLPGAPGEAPATLQPDAKPSTGSNSTDEAATRTPRKPGNPKMIRVYLMDGSVIAGELSVDTVEVTTEFGKLVVPVKQIVSVTPGLESHTKLSAKIKQLVEDLGSDDYKTREQSHKDLMAMGVPVRDVLNEYIDDKNAERKRHATEIVQKLDEMIDEASGDEEFEGSSPKPWVRHDLIVTPKFTIAGKVSPSVFTVKSKYGPLNLSLADIQKAERESDEAEQIAKKLTVPGNNIVQRGMKSSGIRVEPGDTVSVVAEGRIVMSPWGSNTTSGPDGGSNYGSYQEGGKNFFGGTLLARVGDSGQMVKVGSKAKFVIKKSGTLNFGIAMNASYAGNGYYYPGDYKLRIKVVRK